MSDQPDPWSTEVKPWDFVTQAGRPVNCLQRYTQRATGIASASEDGHRLGMVRRHFDSIRPGLTDLHS